MLLLTASLLVLTCTLALIVELETRATATRIESLQARESARLAFYIALAELQKAAGPDQRVTARSDLTGDSTLESHRLWTGVWDTTKAETAPSWLVSGQTKDPSVKAIEEINLIPPQSVPSSGTSPEARLEVALESIEGSRTHMAWSVEDEGIKIPLKRMRGLEEASMPDENTNYLDYNSKTFHNSLTRHKPAFEYPQLYDYTACAPSTQARLERCTTLNQLRLAAIEQEADPPDIAYDSATVENAFVLSNTREGGLKKDLSYLKTLDAESIQHEQLISLYQDPDDLLQPPSVQLVQFRGEPTSSTLQESAGMLPPGMALDVVPQQLQSFSITPVITEFQLSGGIVSDGGEDAQSKPSGLFFVYKLYVELWNPYTIPIRIGDPDMPTDLGFSDLRFEVRNLPDFTIQNLNTGEDVSGTVPDVTLLWSDYDAAKLLRPGMVFRQTLPLDSKGTNQTGALHKELGMRLDGSRSDSYRGQFTFTNKAVEIIVYCRNAAAVEHEILHFTLEGYPDYEIDYAPTNRSTWFKRAAASRDGQYGMNNESLECSGYAFAFRFKLLDEQELPGPIEDISNLLSRCDPRIQDLDVNLQDWDINRAWESTPALPYDFRLNQSDCDPGFFDPAESFSAADFFHYDTSGSGRRDRIARFIDLPTGEPVNPGIFRSLIFPATPLNAIGNPWGGALNRIYDRYFFSTLPKPDLSSWDGTTPLANTRIRAFKAPPALDSCETAEDLMLHNGFNLNSSSDRAWEAVISGRSFSSDAFVCRYEKGAYPANPEWFEASKPLGSVLFNHPHTALYNTTESETDARYAQVERAKTTNYLEAFSINNIAWQADLQHPAFRQSFRELSRAEASALGQAIPNALKEFYARENHPPFSLEEFISAGILQSAIDAVPTINNRHDGQDFIPRHSTASITQATLMNALGPIGFVRSDSFTIRGYGDTRNPVTGEVISSALCEATVQRTPENHRFAKLGRRFTVTDFKWITTSSTQN
ncbi:hypothetical protein [Coraliomargarita parva]|uniref:hypothetical protein n=1 Tax=Coraliomargarita parva TaxID=3014050 RepID=UPI0022B49FA8|nr:hypothetical protein [Coraliomargarita parva]